MVVADSESTSLLLRIPLHPPFSNPFLGGFSFSDGLFVVVSCSAPVLLFKHLAVPFLALSSSSHLRFPFPHTLDVKPFSQKKEQPPSESVPYSAHWGSRDLGTIGRFQPRGNCAIRISSKRELIKITLGYGYSNLPKAKRARTTGNSLEKGKRGVSTKRTRTQQCQHQHNGPRCRRAPAASQPLTSHWNPNPTTKHHQHRYVGRCDL